MTFLFYVFFLQLCFLFILDKFSSIIEHSDHVFSKIRIQMSQLVDEKPSLYLRIDISATWGTLCLSRHQPTYNNKLQYTGQAGRGGARHPGETLKPCRPRNMAMMQKMYPKSYFYGIPLTPRGSRIIWHTYSLRKWKKMREILKWPCQPRRCPSRGRCLLQGRPTYLSSFVY